MNPRATPLRYFAVVALSSLCLLGTAAQAGEIKQDMKLMKRDFNAAQNSASMSEFIRFEQAFKNDVEAASRVNYGDDPATYKKGMQELRAALSEVDAKISANDLAGAKSALKKLNLSKRHYHNQLNV
jgi:soluble cytochrome b562